MLGSILSHRTALLAVQARRAHADPSRIRKALIGRLATPRILELRRERMIKRTFDPGFPIELHQKDLNLALSNARALGLSLPNTATAQELFNTFLCRTVASKWDDSGLVRGLEIMSNHKIGGKWTRRASAERCVDPGRLAAATRKYS